MRTFYTFTILSLITLLSGCSKDVLRSYDKRILGTWKIVDIDRFGFNGDDTLPFEEDNLLTFKESGGLQYEQAGTTYKGSWDIQRQNRNDDAKKSLLLTGIDFNNQQVRSEYFNDMVFTNTNRFTAFINYNTRTYMYRFVRQ